MAAPKKHTLEIDYEIDFSLVALSSEVRAYRLAWSLNRNLHLHFVKCEDLRLDFKDGSGIHLNHYIHKVEHEWMRLVENRASDSIDAKSPFLLPELERFNYLLTIYSEVRPGLGKLMLKQLRAMADITFAKMVDVSELKSRDNLIF